jgi:hypothetical protein
MYGIRSPSLGCIPKTSKRSHSKMGKFFGTNSPGFSHILDQMSFSKVVKDHILKWVSSLVQTRQDFPIF